MTPRSKRLVGKSLVVTIIAVVRDLRPVVYGNCVVTASIKIVRASERASHRVWPDFTSKVVISR